MPLDPGESGWEYSQFFSIVDAAHDWNKPPSFFGICRVEDDPAIMTAYSRTVANMRAVENSEQAKAQKKANRKNNRKGGKK